MTLKADTPTESTGRGSRVVGQIEQLAEDLPARARHAADTLAGWGVGARRFARRNPGTVLIGAFVLGFVLARAARHA